MKRVWTRVTIPGEDISFEVLSGLLEEGSATGVVVADGELRAFFTSARWQEIGSQFKKTVHEFQQDGIIPEGPVTEETAESGDWIAQWRKRLGAIEAGEHFVIVPRSMEGYTPPEDKIVLAIEPRMAFGTGEHDTTRMALSLLEDVGSRAETVLDLGCGNGVLAIGALLLGAGSCLALDNEIEAIEETTENAELHGLADRIAVVEGDAVQYPFEYTYDLILANILFRPIMEGMKRWTDLANTPSHMILTGIQTGEEAEQVKALASELGWQLEEEMNTEHWFAARFFRA